MKELWCWRCQMVVPMLDDEESALVQAALEGGMEVVEAERVRRGIEPLPPLRLDHLDPRRRLIARTRRPMLEMYRLLTGYDETNPSAIWHHAISVYGPPCPACGKPLRTRRARYCAACGYGMEEMRADARPLVERRPEEFGEGEAP